MGQLERTLVDFALSTSFDALGPDVVEAAKAQLLDSLAVGFAGRDADGVQQLLETFDEWGGAPQASVLAHHRRLPAPFAAQANATMIHALDFDDGHGGALMHPGVIVTSTLYAVGERRGAFTGRDLVTGTAIGTDLLCRLGKALIVPTSRAVTGWHFTSIFGCLVSALLSSRLLGLSSEQAANAVGIAYHQTSANMQSVLDGALTKRLGPGFAVRNGVVAALMADKGVTGTPNWLTGRNGLGELYFHGRFDEDVLTADLGRRFEGPFVSLKRYPCCGITHPFIDAAVELKAKVQSSSDISEIHLVRGSAAEYVFEPQETKLRPRNVVDAQFSAPWGVAAALTRGRADPAGYTDAAIRDPGLLAITDRMRVSVDPSLNRSDGIEAGRVGLTLKDGRVLWAESECRVNGDEGRLTFPSALDKLALCVPADDDALRQTVDEIARVFRDLEAVKSAPESLTLFERLA